MDELSVTIIIADRPYKLLIDKTQEEMVRNAAKMIDKKIKEYSGSYSYKDKQDLIAMVALEFGTGLLQKEKTGSDFDKEKVRMLAEIDRTLNEVIQQEM